MPKKVLIINVIAFVLSCLALPFLWACATDCVEMGGVCACNAPEEKLTQVQEVQPSDEKPRRQQQREWEVGLVHAETPPSLAAQDAKADQENRKADFEGKKAIGL